MIRLAAYDFVRYLKRNLITAVFMAILCLIIICLYSLFRYEYGMYKPYQEIGEYADYFVAVRNEFDASEYDCIEQVYTVYQTSIMVDEVRVTAYVYDAWIYSNWEPRIKEGKWLTGNEVGAVQVVLGGITDNCNVDEIYTMDGNIPLKIVGLLQEETKVIWSTSNSVTRAEAMIYLGQYKVPEISGASGMYALITREDADRYGLSYSKTGAWEILRFREGMTEEEKEEVCVQIYAQTNQYGCSWESFIEPSRELFAVQLYGYLPLIVISLLLILLIVFTTSLISTREASAVYSIYYLTGASKQSCYLIALGNVFGTIAMSALFYAVLRAQLLLYAQKNNLTLSLVGTNRYAVILYVSFALFMMWNLYVCMHKQSALKMLKENRG